MQRVFVVIMLSLACISTAFAQRGAAFELGDPSAPARDYTTRVPLESNTVPAQNAALQVALTQVFERASGGSRIPDHYRSRGRDWVESFTLDRNEEGLGLRATFNAEAIDNAVVSADLPLWGALSFGSEMFQVDFGNVRSAEHYARLMRQLSSDRRIDHVEVLHIQGNELTLRLKAQGGPSTVSQVLGNSVVAYPRGSDNTARNLRFDLR